jgi:hypothetical protein
VAFVIIVTALMLFFPPLRPTARASDCATTSSGLTPLTELGRRLYRGSAEGWLYPGETNSRPIDHDRAGLTLARGIEPLDAAGRPDPDGRYALLSIGMSNTKMEFEAFKPIADADPDKDPHLVLVNGAQGGVEAKEWADPNSLAWKVIDDPYLSRAGVTRQQVAAVWVKLANGASGGWPHYADELHGNMVAVSQILMDRYPNLRVAYFSSRIYGGYASTQLNPEPYAYESAFSVTWTVGDQIQGQPALNHDPAKGAVNAPWMSWGPYLWADGLRPRVDGLTWECADFQTDGTHPSPLGQEKVATQLLEFLESDPTAAAWFRKSSLPEPGSGEPTPGTVSTTLQSTHEMIDYQRQFTLSGKVSGDPSCAAAVAIDKRVSGTDASRTLLSSVPVGADGTWAFDHGSAKSATYSASVTSTTSGCRGSATPDLLVQVRADVNLDDPGACVAPEKLLGNVLPKYPGTVVFLQRRTSTGGWITVHEDKLDLNSRYELVLSGCNAQHRILWPSQSSMNAEGQATVAF